MSSDQGRALLYKGAGAIILLMVALIIFFKAQPDEPIQPVLEWSKASHPSSIITNGIDRLAVMENFNQLDTQITDVCFSPVNLNPQQFQSQRQYRLTKRFLNDMKLYKSAEQLSIFIETTRQVIAGKGEVPPSVLDQFNNLEPSPDSRPPTKDNPEEGRKGIDGIHSPNGTKRCLSIESEYSILPFSKTSTELLW